MEDAIVELDQVANPEGCPITEVQTFQVHFTLGASVTDDTP